MSAQQQRILKLENRSHSFPGTSNAVYRNRQANCLPNVVGHGQLNVYKHRRFRKTWPSHDLACLDEGATPKAVIKFILNFKLTIETEEQKLRFHVSMRRS